MVKKDLERVGIAYEMPQGIADFHAATAVDSPLSYLMKLNCSGLFTATKFVSYSGRQGGY
jgi:hypothetical protein